MSYDLAALHNYVGRSKALMTIMESRQSWVGTPVNFSGSVIIEAVSTITFILLLEGIMYMMWKYSTSRFG